VGAETPATVLCDGDAGLWRLQRAALPDVTLVLDWWHAAVHFEHALQAARSLGAGTADARLAGVPAQALRPVPARRADRDLVRGARGGRDHRLAHG